MTMKTASRLCALVVALLLAGSGTTAYLCAAESARPVCPPKLAAGLCHGDDVQASIRCCCTLKDVPVQPDGTKPAGSLNLQPAVPRVIADVPLTLFPLRSVAVAPQPLRTRDIPTLFSTFLL